METPICKVTVIAMRGVISRQGMDEKSSKVSTYPNGGKPLLGYAVKTSGEGIDHVRVSEGSKTPEWIRVCERDGSNPLVSIDYLETQNDVWVKVFTLLATAIQQIALAGIEIARSGNEIAKAIKERK